jgi:lantibiotic modifying enzyme
MQFSGVKYDEPTARSLAVLHIEKIRTVLETKWTSIQNASLDTGLAGLSLFYCYYALYSGNKRYFDIAEEFFKRGIAALDFSDFRKIYKTDSIDCHLATIGRFIGFTGAHGWLPFDADDYLLSLDESLAVLMERKIYLGNFDLNSGALAAGYYYLSRPKDDEAVANHLATLVAGIEEKAGRDKDGDYYWKVQPLENRVFLGISHGNALIMCFVANVYERGIEKRCCERIIHRAAAFLLKQKFRFTKGLFPDFIGDEESDTKQFSLCYGDIGIGYAIYRGGTLLNAPSLLAESDEILSDCLTRRIEDKLTLDGGITYGASGLAAAFEKLYRISLDLRFLKAAEYWYTCIPSYAIHENDFAGYRARGLSRRDIWNTSFGWGIIGIGVSLMRYMKRELPAFDQLLYVA